MFRPEHFFKNGWIISSIQDQDNFDIQNFECLPAVLLCWYLFLKISTCVRVFFKCRYSFASELRSHCMDFEVKMNSVFFLIQGNGFLYIRRQKNLKANIQAYPRKYDLFHTGSKVEASNDNFWEFKAGAFIFIISVDIYSQTPVIRTPIFRNHQIFRIWLLVPIYFAII